MEMEENIQSRIAEITAEMEKLVAQYNALAGRLAENREFLDKMRKPSSVAVDEPV